MILILGALGFVVLAGGVWLFGFRDTATPISRDDVLASLTTTTSTTRAPAITTTTATDTTVSPPPGAEAYVYRTTGFEAVDALGGARHDYPAETFLSERPGGCGTLFRWDALEERFTESEVCDGPGRPLGSVRSYHRWFGQNDDEVFVCDEGAYWLPPDEATTSWAYSCTSDNAVTTYTVQVVGIEMVAIGNRAVDAYHLEVTSVTSGRTVGTTAGEVWRTVEGGLPVREQWVDTSTTDSPIGPVEYEERVDVRLDSLDPIG